MTAKGQGALVSRDSSLRTGLPSYSVASSHYIFSHSVLLGQLANSGASNLRMVSAICNPYSLGRTEMVNKPCLFAIIHVAFALTVLVHAQDQLGFISIDCGLPEGSGYKDDTTGIDYVSDAKFIDTGISKDISPEFNTSTLEKQYWNVQSFPSGRKNCYTLNPEQGRGNNYLIRARFLYGNYDKERLVPEFDLYLGVHFWISVTPEDASTPFTTEMIHVPSSDKIDVCLVNTDLGTPFISVLELRLLNNDTYKTEPGSSLKLHARVNCDLATKPTFRFPDDLYDRIWSPLNSSEDLAAVGTFKRQPYQLGYTLDQQLVPLRTVQTIDSEDPAVYQTPSVVMQTGVAPQNSSHYLVIRWLRDDPTSQFHAYLHFAEIMREDQSREFNVYVNMDIPDGPVVPVDGPVILAYLRTKTISIPALKGRWLDVLMNKTENSTLPPLINAFELYLVKALLQSPTNQEDVNAITNIKSVYQVKKIWHGDPCLPRLYMWEGLNCSYHDNDPPRIISLNLSSSGLTGEVSSHIASLKMLEILDLSNNSLNGPVPDFLSQLPFLRIINLEKNELSGTVPSELIERSDNKTLTLRLGRNPSLCSSGSCKKKNKFIVPVLASISAVFVLIAAVIAVWWSLRRRKQVMNTRTVNIISSKRDGALRSREQAYTYAEVHNITHNLGEVIGKGVFGTVYHGYSGDAQLAVKMLNPPSVQGGYKHFRYEAGHLTGIRHVNLVSIVGYCDEDSKFALIYEYVSNGSLEMHLSDRNAPLLSWQERLQIAIDAAKGLSYLHNGSKPSIIHGYLKSSNILLNENFQAKLSDYGLSGVLPIEIGMHEGYLDPEYSTTTMLNVKSDVFSFGVVLLEIITSRPALARHPERTLVVHWVSFMLEKGDINSIVDPRLRRDFDPNSMAKAVEVAIACVSPVSIKRPTISHVMVELKQCLAMETARRTGSHDISTTIDSIELTPR